VDGLGNVYVAGSNGTVKYNQSGIHQWVSHSLGIAYDLAIDGVGNVYVTGVIQTGVLRTDYAIIKYNPDGIRQWFVRYASNAPLGDDAALAVDGSGDVYVTARVGEENFDLVTIKYNSVGIEQWTVLYNGDVRSPAVRSPLTTGKEDIVIVAVDKLRNVYVKGGEDDYVTIKYNSSGNEQWVARYDGPGTSKDFAKAVAIDGSGNVYVTGVSDSSYRYSAYATIKYNSSGDQQWVACYYDTIFDVNAIKVDHVGNVYVNGTRGSNLDESDFVTIKYNTSGIMQWVARYGGSENCQDRAEALAVDRWGNVYVTGNSKGRLNREEYYVTIKYNSLGDKQWIARYNVDESPYRSEKVIAIDELRNVYITGMSWSYTSYDYITIKYDSVGVGQWVAHYNGPGNDADRAATIAVDKWGNVYVTGRSRGVGTSDDYATIKYNAAGVEQWVARYHAPGISKYGAVALAVDDLGNVYVTGTEGIYNSNHFVTIKYNNAGIEQWVARYNSHRDYDGGLADLTIDDSGNIYVTGSIRMASKSSCDYIVIKYNSDGVEQWVVYYNSLGNHEDSAGALAIDVSGNVYVTGSSGAGGRRSHFPFEGIYTTIKYVQPSVSFKK